MGSNTAIPPDAQNTAIGIVMQDAGGHHQASQRPSQSSSMDLKVLPGPHPGNSDLFEARSHAAPRKVRT